MSKASTRTIPFGRPIIGDAERDAVMAVLDGPILVHGPRAEQFERDFASWTGSPYAVSVSSCTAAMHLAYFSWGIGPGDEVIVPAQTHTATAHAVELAGATPVFVDADQNTGNIDIAAIEAALTARTRAIAVVHFLGVPVEMDAINAIAQPRGLKVLEDCALAIGTKYKGVHAGLLGDAGCFSFYPVKHMTTAEGGMLVTRDGAFAAKLNRQKAFGVDRHMGERKIPGMYDVTMLGYNYRMNEIEAAIGIEQIRRLDAILEKREQNYQALRARLQLVDGIDLLDEPPPESVSSRYCLSVLLKEPLASRRYDIVTELNRRGVGTSVYYPKPVPKMTYYAEKYGVSADAFPCATRISESSIALPVGPHLDGEDMNYIGQTFEQVVGELK